MAQTIFQGVTSLTAVAAVLFTFQSLDYTADATRATRDQVRLADRGQITDRFSRAIDQLGQVGPDKLSIRLGGIYALERIMRDSPEDGPTIIEVLCAFIRTNARDPQPGKAQEIPPSSDDVRAAITVLGRRPKPHAPQNQQLDLAGTQLSLQGISLKKGNFAGADLISADLTAADLSGVDMSRSNMLGVDLFEAALPFALLQYANLRDADLRDADLREVDFRNANLSGSDLRNAYLGEAKLDRANLRGVNLTGVTGITSQDLRCTWVDERTQLPSGVTGPEGVALEARGC